MPSAREYPPPVQRLLDRKNYDALVRLARNERQEDACHALVEHGPWNAVRRVLHLVQEPALHRDLIDRAVAEGFFGELVDYYMGYPPPAEVREYLIAKAVSLGAVDLARRASWLRPERRLKEEEVSELVGRSLEQGNLPAALRALRAGARPEDLARVVEWLLERGQVRLAAEIAKRGARGEVVDRLVRVLVDQGDWRRAQEIAALRDEGRGGLRVDERSQLVEHILKEARQPAELWVAIRLAAGGVEERVREELVERVLRVFSDPQLTPDRLPEVGVPTNWYETFLQIVRAGVSERFSDALLQLHLQYGSVEDAFWLARQRATGRLTEEELRVLRAGFLRRYRKYLPEDPEDPATHERALKHVVLVELRNPFPNPRNLLRAARLRRADGEPVLEEDEKRLLAEALAREEAEQFWSAEVVRALLTKEDARKLVEQAVLAGEFETAYGVARFFREPEIVDWLVEAQLQKYDLRGAERAAQLREPPGLRENEVDFLVLHFTRQGDWDAAIEVARKGASREGIDYLVNHLIDRADYRRAVEVARLGASPEMLDLLVRMAARRGYWEEALEASRLRNAEGVPALREDEATLLVEAMIAVGDIVRAYRAAAFRPEPRNRLTREELEKLVEVLLRTGRYREAVEVARAQPVPEVLRDLEARLRDRDPRLADEISELLQRGGK